MNSVRMKRVRLLGDQDSTGELISRDVEGEQHIRVQSKKRRPKKRDVLIGMLLLLVLLGTGSSVAGFMMYHAYNARYHTDLSLAQTGTQHLQKAEALLGTWSKRPLDTQLTGQAEIEFASAFKTFGQLNSDLRSLPEMIKQIPSYGTPLNAALHLVPLAMTLSQAGTTGCTILHILGTGLRDPLTPQGRGITLSDLTVVTQDVQKLKASLATAARQVSQLQPGDMQFDARIPRLVNYLIEVLDSTELRPGGGFIGNYGIASLSNGRLSAAHITDVDLIDKPFESAGHVLPYPPAYGWFDLAPGSWSFRDSNLDADFPTAARYGEQTYREEGGHVPVQGVIAITPALIEQALAITGPITVPEYHETVTAQNLIARIHFHQLGHAGEGSDLIPSPDGHSSLRKRFTELLAEHFLARVHQLAPGQLSKFVLLIVNAVHSKDLQLYLNTSVAENLLHRFHLDAAIQSPVGDSLFVVDANIAPNKANNFITNTLDDQVTIDSQGNVIHHATLRYAWTIAGRNYGSSLYRDFVHVYVPPKSILLTQDGWQPRGASNAFNREVWMGYFELSYGQTRTVTLVWKVPAAASRGQSGWRYQYVVQKQAGVLWKLNLQIMLPSCATAIVKRGGLISNYEHEAKLTHYLTGDLNVGADYTCR